MPELYRPPAAIRINRNTDSIIASYGFDESSFVTFFSGGQWAVNFAGDSDIAVANLQVEVTSTGAQNRIFFGSPSTLAGAPGILITTIDPTTGLVSNSFSPVLGMAWNVFGGLI